MFTTPRLIHKKRNPTWCAGKQGSRHVGHTCAPKSQIWLPTDSAVVINRIEVNQNQTEIITSISQHSKSMKHTSNDSKCTQMTLFITHTVCDINYYLSYTFYTVSIIIYTMYEYTVILFNKAIGF